MSCFCKNKKYIKIRGVLGPNPPFWVQILKNGGLAPRPPIIFKFLYSLFFRSNTSVRFQRALNHCCNTNLSQNMSINVILGSNLKSEDQVPDPHNFRIFIIFSESSHPYASNEPSITSVILIYDMPKNVILGSNLESAHPYAYIFRRLSVRFPRALDHFQILIRSDFISILLFCGKWKISLMWYFGKISPPSRYIVVHELRQIFPKFSIENQPFFLYYRDFTVISKYHQTLIDRHFARKKDFLIP